MAGRSRRASARAGWRKRSAVAPIQAQPLDHSSDDVLVGLDWRFAEAGHLGLGPVPEERRRFLANSSAKRQARQRGVQRQRTVETNDASEFRRPLATVVAREPCCAPGFAE
jgi:hypothetical protein